MELESRKRIEEDIIKSLKESSVGMVGICGVGGVGKTTMANRIRERVMEEKLFDEVVMVVVSQPVDMLKIQYEVAELLGLMFYVKGLPARAYRLRTRLKDTKRKIIIFDDVSEMLKLEDLGVPSGFEGCKILLTTRYKDVCVQMEVKKIITMEILTEEEAWILLKQKAGNCLRYPTLLSVSKDVVAECNGLPIALVTVGKALQNKGKSIWEDSLLQLKRANPTDFSKVVTDVYKPLKLSYDHLDNEREKFLFLLCCLFREDYDIPVEELTLYFMGLQKFDDITSIQEARNRMHRLVENLKSRFMLIDGRGKHRVKMHDVFRNVAIYIGSKEKDCLAKSLNKISIENSSDINCNWMPVTQHSLEGIGDLNVLSFSNISIGSLPPTLALLQNLRTLYLYNCKVGDISVIGELAGLEILYCNNCDEIEELPAEIGRLNRLRLLEFKRCCKLQRIPFGILSSLVRLEELKMLRSFDGWEAEENGKEKRNASVRELECLPNLTCLEIQISDSNLAVQEICLSPKLVKYRIVIGFDNYWDEDRDDYEKVMNLYLPSYIGAVGKWIQNLVKNTEYLFLEGDGSNNINLEECQDLRKLIVRYCSTLKKLVKTKDCKSGIVFPMLERLKLECLDNLEEIWDGTIILNQNNVSSLCNLKSVYINKCFKFRYLFSVSVATTCLLQLEVLVIQYCSAMEQVFRNDITHGCIQFPKLKELIIRRCSKLRYLFSESVATTCLLQLEVLVITTSAMEQVFMNVITDGDGCIEFPKLKILTLRHLPNLTAFCQGIENINFPSLTEMSIAYIPNLNSFCLLNSETPFHFVWNRKGDGSNNINEEESHSCIGALGKWIQNLVKNTEYLFLEGDGSNNINLEECQDFSNLKVDNCSTLKKVVKTKDCKSGINVFPMLERLRLEFLDNLEEIWDGTIILNQNVSLLSNLKYLNIDYCSKLRYLLPVSIATTCLLQLEDLYIRNCSAMEQVFRNDMTDGCIEFPKLKTLMISGCSKLRYLLSMSVATTCLLQLQVLEIDNCEAMEQVFRNNDITDGCIEFPKLNTLILRNLPNLTAFCQGIENINFPQLIIGHLPKLNSETPHDRNPFHFLCNPKVEICGLKTLTVWSFFNNIRNVWYHQIPINFFNNIKNQNTSMIEDEDEDANKGYNNENVNEDKNENEDANKDEDKDENNIKYNNENVNKEEDETERK